MAISKRRGYTVMASLSIIVSIDCIGNGIFRNKRRASICSAEAQLNLLTSMLDRRNKLCLGSSLFIFLPLFDLFLFLHPFPLLNPLHFFLHLLFLSLQFSLKYLRPSDPLIFFHLSPNSFFFPLPLFFQSISPISRQCLLRFIEATIE